jgi:NAD(P)-dependent dehydrogenase (short-subunit alcohol dehydrogenase family)
MNIGIVGASSEIAKIYKTTYCRNAEIHEVRDIMDVPNGCDEVVIFSGVLHGKSLEDMTYEQAHETFDVNFFHTAKGCDLLLKNNPVVRIGVVGSMSGVQGSYDMAYAGAKAAMHLYVKTKKVGFSQHLVGVAPWIISDAAMTTRRQDLDYVKARGEERRMQRWLTSYEIAQVLNFAMKHDAVCNTVIEAAGGNW